MPFPWSITLISSFVKLILSTLNVVELFAGSYLSDPSKITSTVCGPEAKLSITNIPLPPETGTV